MLPYLCTLAHVCFPLNFEYESQHIEFMLNHTFSILPYPSFAHANTNTYTYGSMEKFGFKYESPHMEFPRVLNHTFSILPYMYTLAHTCFPFNLDSSTKVYFQRSFAHAHTYGYESMENFRFTRMEFPRNLNHTDFLPQWTYCNS